MLESKSVTKNREGMGQRFAEFSFEMAEITLLIRSRDSSFVKRSIAIYKGFLSRKASDFVLETSVYPKLSFRPPGPVRIKSDNGVYLVNSYNFEGEVNLDAGFAIVRVAPEWDSFDAFLRILYSLLLPRKKGIIVHASGVLRQGLGYVFAGLPESGKSTIAHLSQRYTVIGDELLVLRRINSHVQVFDTPFWNDGPADRRTSPAAVPVRAIFLLAKDKRTYLRKLGPLDTATRMLPNIFYEPEQLDLNQETLNALVEILEVTPSYHLHFIPVERELWRCLNEIV